jgi:glycosyltransferase involved in cell wall biosynthesis
MKPVELSIVMPCLDEAQTVARCIRKAQDFLSRAAIAGEVIVADNGSKDGSQQLAMSAGARVIHVRERGYGAALSAGIRAAEGRFVIMGDADDSYDFAQLQGFVDKLRDGFELVMGNRFAGGIERGAMPWLHRYLGNPVLSFLGRLFFRARINDFHCGLRGFKRESIARLNLSTSGMEFASEMVVKAALARLRIAEVPTKLSQDGRDRAPHLRTWRDGWRHLRFLLLFSPRWLFLYPGLLLLALGGSLQACLLHGGIRLGSLGLDIHTMLYAGAMSVIGTQMVWFAILAKVFAARAGLLPHDTRVERALRTITLERGIGIGLGLISAGILLSIGTVHSWAVASYGALDPQHVMRIAIPAVSMMIAGMEFVGASFFLGLLRFEQPLSESTQPASGHAAAAHSEIPTAASRSH